jgi:hypothetical protein
MEESLVNNNFGRMWKEVVVGPAEVLYHNGRKGLRKTTETSVRIVSVPVRLHLIFLEYTSEALLLQLNCSMMCLMGSTENAPIPISEPASKLFCISFLSRQ